MTTILIILMSLLMVTVLGIALFLIAVGLGQLLAIARKRDVRSEWYENN